LNPDFHIRPTSGHVLAQLESLDFAHITDQDVDIINIGGIVPPKTSSQHANSQARGDTEDDDSLNVQDHPYFGEYYAHTEDRNSVNLQRGNSHGIERQYSEEESVNSITIDAKHYIIPSSSASPSPASSSSYHVVGHEDSMNEEIVNQQQQEQEHQQQHEEVAVVAVPVSKRIGDDQTHPYAGVVEDSDSSSDKSRRGSLSISSCSASHCSSAQQQQYAAHQHDAKAGGNSGMLYENEEVDCCKKRLDGQVQEAKALLQEQVVWLAEMFFGLDDCNNTSSHHFD